MRRLIAVLPTACAALLLLSAPALAAPSHGKKAAHPHGTHATHESHESHGQHQAKPKPKHVEHEVTLVGVISATPTATIASSVAATSTITIRVKGGDHASHGRVIMLTLDSQTVVRRGDASATAADLRLGDHVSVRARRAANGTWVATRVNAAAGRERD